MTAPQAKPTRWYLFHSEAPTAAAKVTGFNECEVWNKSTPQWTPRPIAEQVEFNDTSWDQVTEDDVNKFTGEGVKP